jgi:MYXO-CTERM domain-containing protein
VAIMTTTARSTLFATALLLLLPAPAARAHSANFKSPAGGMHFTQGQPIVVFADLFDDRDGKGFIVCPSPQLISNYQPPPSYTDPPRVAICSGQGTPTGWPQLQLVVDIDTVNDVVTQRDTVPNTIAFNHDLNPDPIGYFRFVVASDGLSIGPHNLTARGKFSNDAMNIVTVDSKAITIFIDAPPAKDVVMVTSDMTGTVSWDNKLVIGNGHAVTASGSLLIRNSLVTGLSRLDGSVSDAEISGSIFEDTGPLSLTFGNGNVAILGNEFRANNRLTFVANDPAVPFIIDFRGSGQNLKRFQGNRVGAGQLSFGGQSWLIGGDIDAESNVLIGPRCVLNVSADNTVIRGNYSHHNYRGGWSQGFNFYYLHAGANILTQHNFIRDSSWPVQALAGEFSYNVVYGYGHTWIRDVKPNAIIHHNLFVPGGDGGLNDGIEVGSGQTGIQIYNNTFDGGGVALGDFSGPTIAVASGGEVLSFRNNLVTFSRDLANGTHGDVRVVGGTAGFVSADYNAFYSPDDSNKTNYDFAGAGAHDPSDAPSDQLAANPFAGARIATDADRIIDPMIDEASVWLGAQRLSTVLRTFRGRYTPKAGSPVVDHGDPNDHDAQGRLPDVGAIDLGGHDQDKLGMFGVAPSELVPPTVALTAPSAHATLTGTVTLSADAQDNAGGSGVVLVQFLVDGSLVGQIATKPYTISFDSAIVSNADHQIAAKAWDDAGNFAVSAAVPVTVAGNVSRHPTADAGCGCRVGAPPARPASWLLALAALGLAVCARLRRRRMRPRRPIDHGRRSSLPGARSASLPSTRWPRSGSGGW